jgi:hypothetical protein
MSDQLPLTCPTPNKRPIEATNAMRMEAALETAEELIENGGFDSKDIGDIADDILKAASRSYGKGDGFSLAYELKRSCHWEIADDMVEILADYWAAVDGKLRFAEKQWAAENPMEPPLPIGALVKTPKGTLPITSVSDYAPHSYCVQQSPKSWLIVRFEDAVLAE